MKSLVWVKVDAFKDIEGKFNVNRNIATNFERISA